MKNIVLLIDGTWQTSKNETNVAKLASMLVRNQAQKVEYMEGIATDGGFLRKKINGAMGVGVTGRICDAYKFLAKSYVPGDSIYLFGFSRGAFAVRALAGFIDAVGLLFESRASDHNVSEAFKIYQASEDSSQSELRDYLQELTGSRRPSKEDHTVLPIHFIGVWDVVGALHRWERSYMFSAQFTEKYETTLPESVTHARHALAMHEMRKSFEPLLWTGHHANRTDQTLIQAWFPGDHSDIGGGHEDHRELSLATLDWMVAEARKKGLIFNGIAEIKRSDVAPRVHYEFKRWFLFALPCARKLLYSSLYNDIADKTYYFHDSALRHFLDKERRRYSYRSRINLSLRDADRCAFELFLKLSGSRDRRAHSPEAGKILAPPSEPAPEAIENLRMWDVNCEITEWWKRIDIDKIADWSGRLEELFVERSRFGDCVELHALVCLCLAFEGDGGVARLRGLATKMYEAMYNTRFHVDHRDWEWAIKADDWSIVSELCAAGRNNQLASQLRNAAKDITQLVVDYCNLYQNDGRHILTSPAAPAPSPASPP